MTADATIRTRVLLADDHTATLRRWRELLEPEFEVVASVGDGQALIDAAERLSPDVIVTDIVMPGMSGIAAAGRILQRRPAARIVFATVHADRTLLRHGLAVGAFGYVLKVRAAQELVPAIRSALRDELHISRFSTPQNSTDGSGGED
jgi:DNA-binding NarL/FixJ family response regulator